jgi:hypothetical protein
VVVACNTGDGPTKGCSEIPIPSGAVQAYKDDCQSAGSVVSDACPTTGATAKCTPTPGAFGPLTPNVLYWYAVTDAKDVDKAKSTCDGLTGTFEVL